MRLLITSLAFILIAAVTNAQQPLLNPSAGVSNDSYIGFDRNDYPGDSVLPTLRKHFAFTGYWLNNPPGEQQNTWAGKRDILLRNNFGFLVLFNGRLEAEINKAQKSGTAPTALGQKDAASAIAAAQREHFPAHTILFLDQEEGGRLEAPQSVYLFAWTEAIARSPYLPGAYVSGQPVPDAPGQTITTAQNIREEVAAKHLHPITLFIYQDSCPPSNGCTLHPPDITAAGTPNIAAWQYAQSPRRPEITRACAKTYAPNGNCYTPDLPNLHLDLSVSPSPDPSHGR
ncbi:hypothetical protein EDE15_3364 [Edaphobacter aggregans]|uniref:Rv2525c-like glycoside hydrolase-like domain-containing protein n=1 Tax=Edaphobacter aggregans TaxID=570835 RepID=A0A3R9WI86_9BACT|nr:glycoside hydrolase domain-containing protein [Edaphobacter aggregans]RSL17815.1 hypothetical protein EDE15_3364 [Edaphobacter aggregans]